MLQMLSRDIKGSLKALAESSGEKKNLFPLYPYEAKAIQCTHHTPIKDGKEVGRCEATR